MQGAIGAKEAAFAELRLIFVAPLLFRMRLENEVENDYKEMLQQKCYNERMVRMWGKKRAWEGAWSCTLSISSASPFI